MRLVKGLSFLFALVLSYPLSAAETSTPMQSECQRLRQQFKQQSFYENRLPPSMYVENGGMCGPTCAVNIMRVFDKVTDRPSSIAQDFIRIAAMNTWWEARKKKPLMAGTAADPFKDMLESIFPQLGFEGTFEFVSTARNTRDQYLESLNGSSGRNTISITAILNLGGFSGHWVVIVGADVPTGVVKYIDPNYPTEVRTFRVEEEKYWKVKDHSFQEYFGRESSVTLETLNIELTSSIAKTRPILATEQRLISWQEVLNEIRRDAKNGDTAALDRWLDVDLKDRASTGKVSFSNGTTTSVPDYKSALYFFRESLTKSINGNSGAINVSEAKKNALLDKVSQTYRTLELILKK